MILLRLYYEFFKTGLFAVGGGLATLPFLQAMAESTGWFTTAQLADMIAVSESTPGPMGVNAATYVGFLTAGIPGALAATLGLITPSIIIILIIAAFLQAFRHNRYVENIFYGLRPASTGLIAASGLSVVAMAFSAAARRWQSASTCPVSFWRQCCYTLPADANGPRISTRSSSSWPPPSSVWSSPSDAIDHRASAPTREQTPGPFISPPHRLGDTRIWTTAPAPLTL